MSEQTLDMKTIKKALSRLKNLSEFIVNEIENGNEFERLMAFTRLTNLFIIDDALEMILKMGMNTGIIANNLSKQEEACDPCKTWNCGGTNAHPMYKSEKSADDEKENPLHELIDLIKKLRK